MNEKAAVPHPLTEREIFEVMEPQFACCVTGFLALPLSLDDRAIFMGRVARFFFGAAVGARMHAATDGEAFEHPDLLVIRNLADEIVKDMILRHVPAQGGVS